jgi:hypothetical protein
MIVNSINSPLRQNKIKKIFVTNNYSIDIKYRDGLGGSIFLVQTSFFCGGGGGGHEINICLSDAPGIKKNHVNFVALS